IVVLPSFPSTSLAHRHPHSFPTRRSSDLGSADRCHALPRRSPHTPALACHVAPATHGCVHSGYVPPTGPRRQSPAPSNSHADARSEEHTSELQSRENLVCRLLLEKKNR